MNAKLIKRILVAGLALVGLLGGQAVYAQASQNATVTVNAVVPKACRFYSSPAPMLIQHGGGLIDPASGVAATGSTTLNYRCQNTVSPEFDIDTSGAYASPKNATVVLTSGPNNMSASITVTATGGAGTGLGAGQDKTATIDGSIVPANFQAAVPGSYTKDVLIEIRAIP